MSLVTKLRAWLAPPEAPLAPDAERREQFLREVEELAGKAHSVRRHPDQFALLIQPAGAEAEKQLSLENLFADTAGLPGDERRSRIEQLLGMLLSGRDLPERWQDAEPLLMPVLRGASMLADPQSQELAPVARSFAPYMIECVVADFDDAMAYVVHGALERWNVSADVLFDSARRNLARHAAKTPAVPRRSGQSAIFQLETPDDYQSSRLLLPEFLRAFLGRVPGAPVAAVPHRGLLMVAGSDDASALGELAETAERQYRASTRGLSCALYTLANDGRVVPFHPDSEHPLHGRVARGHQLLAMAEYEAQQRRLSAFLRQRQDSLFVAGYTAIHAKTGERLWSYAAWGQELQTLLPQTDLVGFVGGPEHEPWHFFVPWAAVEELAGDCWQAEPGLNPPRMRTLRFPSAARLAKLREREVDLDAL